MKLTCKDCQAFERDVEGDSGVCVLNPPMMIIGKDPDTGEDSIMSIFPQVDGEVTRCMKLIKIVGMIFFCLGLCSCAILKEGFKKYAEQENYRNSPAYYRDHVVCRTYKNAWQNYVTECR